MRRFSKTSITALLWVGVAFAQSAPRGISTFNLRDYGWEPSKQDRRHAIGQTSLAIDHTGRVVLGFTARERSGLVTRNAPSLGFRILRLAADGKSDLSLSLPTNATGATGLYLSDTDQIIARANERVQLLQSVEANPTHATWLVLGPCVPWQCFVSLSPTHHTLLLSDRKADLPLRIVRLSPQPSSRACGKPDRLIESAEDKIQNHPSITDEFAYFSSDGDAYRWPLCDYEHRVDMPFRTFGGWRPLTDSLFVREKPDRKEKRGLEVLSADGQLKFRPELAQHESLAGFNPVGFSERGDRIAVDVATLRGGVPRLDIDAHPTARRIAVFDVEAGKEVASIPVGVKHQYQFRFTLSPDGHRLAILEDDQLRLIDLDVAKPGAQ